MHKQCLKKSTVVQMVWQSHKSRAKLLTFEMERKGNKLLTLALIHGMNS